MTTPTPETTTTTVTLQDPGFKLPPAVAASIARADALMASQVEPQPVAEIPEPAPAQEPAAPAAVTEPVTEPVHADPAKPVDWEARYKAMKGRHDKQAETISTLTADVAELRRQLAHAQATRAAPAQAPAPSQFTVEDLTPEERADYGEDLLKVVDKVAGRKIAEIVGAYDQKFTDLSEKVEGVTKVTRLSSQDRYVQTLTQRVPNWREINQDPAFVQWLDEQDVFSGQKRQDLLLNAHNAEDAPRVAAIFSSFLKEAQPSAAPQEEVRSDPKPPGKVSLESLAAPGRARSTAPEPGPGDKPIIARSEIQKFFADVAAGKYRGRQAEKDRREAEIFEATNEGRVR